jgi:hypothetical protein
VAQHEAQEEKIIVPCRIVMLLLAHPRAQHRKLVRMLGDQIRDAFAPMSLDLCSDGRYDAFAPFRLDLCRGYLN